MDSHNVARNRTETTEQALKQIQANTLVIGLTTDILFPISEQKYLAKHITGSIYAEIDSAYGHDGFLIETNKLTQVIKEYYNIQQQKNNELNLQTNN
jgi:homoserine O-acetyltransferase